MSMKNEGLCKHRAITHLSLKSYDMNTDLISVNEPDLLEHTLDLVAQVQNHFGWKYSVLSRLCSPADHIQLFLLSCIDWEGTAGLLKVTF